MPHISKRKLNKEHFNKLVLELIKSLERSFKKGETKSVFYEFFTYTERAMLAKRLAVIAMLSKKISSYAVAETLHMSPSTVDRMSLKYKHGKYEAIIKYALGKEDIWETINQILTIGGLMLPKVGGKRWRKLDKSIYDQKLLES